MKKLLQPFVMLMALMLATACGKSENPEAPEKPVVTRPVPVPPGETPAPAPVTVIPLIPTIMEAPGHKMEFSYVPNSNMLASMADSKGQKMVLHYKDTLPTGFTLVNQNQTFQNDIWRDVNKVINKISTYQDLGSIKPGGDYRFTYTQLNQIEEIRYYSAAGKLIKTSKLSYDQEGLLIALDTEEGNNHVLQQFTYDQKNGMFKHVPLAWLLYLETRREWFCAGSHNLLSTSQGGETSSFSYEYQADGFPSQMTQSKGGVQTVYKISYKTF